MGIFGDPVCGDLLPVFLLDVCFEVAYGFIDTRQLLF